MSEPGDLRRKLAALADTGAVHGAKGRIISEAGFPSPVQAILTEVSETALAQDLTFHVGDVGLLVLVVSGRRILAVRSVEGLVMPAVAEQLAGKPLSADADATHRALMALLMQIDLMRETVETTSSDGAPFSAPADAGLSAERVAVLAGVSFPVKAASPLEKVLALLPSPPVGSILTEAGGAPQETGAADEVARLTALAQALGIEGGPDAASPKLSIFGQQSGRAPFIGAVRAKSGVLLWSMAEQDVGAGVAAFHKIFGDRAR